MPTAVRFRSVSVNRGEMGEAFGAVLREQRKRAGISQERLALISGYDRSGLGRMERGEHLPSIPTLFVLAETLGTTPDALVKRVRTRLGKRPPKKRG